MPESAPTLTEWLADPLSSWGALPPAGDHICDDLVGTQLSRIDDVYNEVLKELAG